jgi:hypothetical protein
MTGYLAVHKSKPLVKKHAIIKVVPNTDSLLVGGGLYLPSLSAPMPTVSGLGVTKFGQDYTQSAFNYGFAFLYQINRIPDLWNPNLKSDPNFIPSLKLQLLAFSNYLTGDLKNNYVRAIPSIVNPTTDANTANWWRQVFLIPARLPDGTIPVEKDGLTLVAPFDLGVSVGSPKTGVSDVPNIGSVLTLRFKWASNLTYGKTSVTEYQRLERDVTLYIMPNLDKTVVKDYPWVIVGMHLNGQNWGETTPYSQVIPKVAP